MTKMMASTVLMVSVLFLSSVLKAECNFPIVGSAYMTNKGNCKVVRSKEAKKFSNCKPDQAPATGRAICSCKNDLWLFENLRTCEDERNDEP